MRILIIGLSVLLWRLAGALALGLLSGLIVGLSRSQVVAPLVAGVLIVADRIVQGYFAARTNPPTLTTASNPCSPWILPISLGAILGIISGIYIRANDSLSRPHNIPRQLTALGFNDEQIMEIMNREAKKEVAQLLSTDDVGSSHLLAGVRSRHAVHGRDAIINEAARQVALMRKESDENILTYLEASGSDALKAELRRLQSADDSLKPEQILYRLLNP